MLLFDLLIAILVGGFLTFIFSQLFRRTGYLDNTFMFFVITFLGTWAIGLWIKPIGPTFLGYYWIGYLSVGILIAMIIASTGPPNTFRREDLINNKEKEDYLRENRKSVLIKKDKFILGLTLIFILTIIMGYLTK